MPSNSMQLYKQMQEEIDHLKLCCNNEMLMIEGCFTIANHYWNKIKSNVAGSFFKCEAEEINFFKHVKPLFIAVLKYYTLYYQAILFKPPGNRHEQIQYWLSQLKRVDTFYERHREFYQYYMTDQTSKDKLYFINPESKCSLTDEVLCDSKSSISYAHIAARLLGYREYRKLAETELEHLVKGKPREQLVQKKMTDHVFTILCS